MLKQAAFRLAAGLICLLVAAAAVATPPAGPAPPPQSPEVMLYMSWPVGAGSRGFQIPRFSLRLGQARMGGNSGNPLAIGDPMRHREFLRLEVAGRQNVSALDMHALDMRVRFAGRLTYDVNHGVFGLHADSRTLPALLPPKRFAPNVFQVRTLHSASVAVDRVGSRP
jgi:hypothetical protein